MMSLISSSLVMLGFFVLIVIMERRDSQREDAFFERTEPQINELAVRAKKKYQARYGKEPTGEFRLIVPPAEKS